MIYLPARDCQTPGLEYIYSAIFGQKTDGTFVEIGANDGISWSNTAFLAKIGWKGLYVEPMPHFYEQCRANYIDNDRIVVSNAMIGSGDFVEVYSHKGYDDLYTADPDFVKNLSANNLVGTFPTVPLHDLLEVYSIPREFELLVIDVEGMELEVLRSPGVLMWRPQMLIIETHELSPNEGLRCHTFQIDYCMQALDYSKIYTSEINTIYIDRKKL